MRAPGYVSSRTRTRLGPRALRPAAGSQELQPDERADGDEEHDERDPEVEALPEEVVRRVDAEQLLERAPERVPGDVEAEERGRPDPEEPVDEQEHPDPGQVPEGLVQEGRMEGRGVRVALRPVLRVDLEPPGQVGRLPEELLVPVVAPASDRLGEQETGGDTVHHQRHARARPPHDDRAGEHAAGDPAPDAEPSLPHRERPPPGVRNLVPARDVVVDPGPDDAGRDAPDRGLEDEIPAAAAPRPAHARQPDRGGDAEQEHQAVHVERERPDVNAAAGRRGDGREEHGQDDSARVTRPPLYFTPKLLVGYGDAAASCLLDPRPSLSMLSGLRRPPRSTMRPKPIPASRSAIPTTIPNSENSVAR